MVMVIKSFPPVEFADRSGLLAIGGDCTVDSLLLAYRNGIFPWEGDPLLWFAPPKRAVLFLDNFHISRTLQKSIRKCSFDIKFNRQFRDIINRCAHASNRKGSLGSWLTQDMIDGYCNLYDHGYAYCIGAFSGSELVGGVYGVTINGFISAESMFYDEPNSSKLCLYSLVEFLKANNISWLDCQAINPFTRTLGVVEISREEFMIALQASLGQPTISFPQDE